MIIKLNGNTFKVQWKHIAPNSEKKIGRVRATNGGTSCFINAILDNDSDKLWALSELKCYYKDCYSKETGRKISLAMALKDASFNKTDRTVFWKAYFNRKS